MKHNGNRVRHRHIRLCLLAAIRSLLALWLRQNVLLGTASKHEILMNVQTGQVLAKRRVNEETAPASLTKIMTILLAVEAEPDLDRPVTLPEDIFPALYAQDASMAGFAPGETVTVWGNAAFWGGVLRDTCPAGGRQPRGICCADEPESSRARHEPDTFQQPHRPDRSRSLFHGG